MVMENTGIESSEGTEGTEEAGEPQVVSDAVPENVPEKTFEEKILEKATSGLVKNTAPKFQPNYKFKVLDKEHEFEGWAKNAIKDADTEKRVREFHEKAYGLDSVKTDRQNLKNHINEMSTELVEHQNLSTTLNEALDNKDYTSFFEAWNIPNEEIVRYALEVIEREQNPDAKAQWESSREQSWQSQQYEEQQNQLAANQQSFEVQRRTYELDMQVSRPEISQFVKAYDTGMGYAGAFSEYVTQIGAARFASTGQDISAEQAVQEAVRHLQAVNPQLGQPNGQAQTRQVVAPNQKPVIPNIRGNGGSPVRAQVRSIDDLKKRGQDLAARGL